MIVDLVNDRVEVREEPAAGSYARRAIYGGTDVIHLNLGSHGSLALAVDELLPPRRG